LGNKDKKDIGKCKMLYVGSICIAQSCRKLYITMLMKIYFVNCI